MKFTDKLALTLINDAKKPKLQPGYSTPAGRGGGMIRKLKSGEEGNPEIHNIGKSGRTSHGEHTPKNKGAHGAVGDRDRLQARLKAYKANIMKESKIELYTTMAYLVTEVLGLGRDVGTDTQRAFKIGQEMANRELKKPETAKVNKQRREGLRKAGHGSVSAGMADQSNRNRAKKNRG